MKDAGTLGEFEIMVVAAVLHLGSDAYGATVRQEIESRTGRNATVGAIYTTLSRLEDKGLVSSKLGAATAERGGRPKRFFKITVQGNRAFDNSVSSLGNMLEGLGRWQNIAT